MFICKQKAINLYIPCLKIQQLKLPYRKVDHLVATFTIWFGVCVLPSFYFMACADFRRDLENHGIIKAFWIAVTKNTYDNQSMLALVGADVTGAVAPVNSGQLVHANVIFQQDLQQSPALEVVISSTDIQQDLPAGTPSRAQTQI